MYNTASADKTNIKRSVASLEISPQFDGYTRVEMTVDENTVYTSGTESGRTLRVDCPWGSQQVADNILASIKGYQYQPYTAPGALLDPSAELMDGVTIDTTYGGIYGMDLDFGPCFAADLAAPCDEETDHEYPYKAQKDRRIYRRMAGMASELRIHADQISAKVEKTGGDGGSFAWEMEWDHHTWKANGMEVFRLDAAGAAVTGEIRATSGRIGGFEILQDRLSYNDQDWGGYNSRGCYFGPFGLQLGSWDEGFHVDTWGNLYAQDGEFRGVVCAGSISYGGQDGYFSGAGLSSHSVGGGEIGYSSVSTSHTSSGINTSLGYANYSNDVFNGYVEADWLNAREISARRLYTGNLAVGGTNAYWRTATISGVTITYLGQ